MKMTVARQILDLLADRRPWRQRQILERIPRPKISVARTLGLLVRRGDLLRIQHGVYILAGVPVPAASEIPLPDRSTAGKLWSALEYLDRHRTMSEIKNHLGVSLPQVRQVLSRLENVGKIRRLKTPGEVTKFTFIRVDIDESTLIEHRHRNIAKGLAKAMSSLLKNEISRVKDVVDASGTAYARIFSMLNQLESLGLVYTFRFGKPRYAGLTPAGAAHPDYDALAPKAAAADLISDFGPCRVLLLQALSASSELGTMELTDALPADLFAGRRYGPGSVIQNLEDAELICAADQTAGGRAAYRLTAKGVEVTRVINRASRLPTEAELKGRIQRRRAARTNASPVGSFDLPRDGSRPRPRGRPT